MTNLKKDVQQYFIKMQQDMNQMNKVLEKVNKEIEEGRVSDDQRANFETYYATVKNNYERVSYIMHLLNLPPKFIQNIHNKKLLKEQEDFFKKLQATQGDINSENNEAIKSMTDELESINGA